MMSSHRLGESVGAFIEFRRLYQRHNQSSVNYQLLWSDESLSPYQLRLKHDIETWGGHQIKASSRYSLASRPSRKPWWWAGWCISFSDILVLVSNFLYYLWRHWIILSNERRPPSLPRGLLPFKRYESNNNSNTMAKWLRPTLSYRRNLASSFANFMPLGSFFSRTCKVCLHFTALTIRLSWGQSTRDTSDTTSNSQPPNIILQQELELSIKRQHSQRK